MVKTAMIEVRDGNAVKSLQAFLKALLTQGFVDALLVAQHLPNKSAVMPTLVSDPEQLDRADPLAPAFPLNAAKVMSKLSRRPLGATVGAVLRPCEIRAFVELIKLKQGSLDDVVLIGIDCLGTFRNLDYLSFVQEDALDSTMSFYRSMGCDGKGVVSDAFELSPSCRACEYPTPNENADLAIGVLGCDIDKGLIASANTSRGESILGKLNLPETREPAGRKEAIAALVEKRIAYRDRMFKETSEATATPEKLISYLSNCVNCYNCRVACPVCYCKECVFVTDVFDHEPAQYLKWAKRRGIIKMPTDTTFYHITRLAHMSTACIGCGQCSNACPNEIPVMQLFRTIASGTQKAFDYEPGQSLEDAPPLSAFREHEFSEVTGGKD